MNAPWFERIALPPLLCSLALACGPGAGRTLSAGGSEARTPNAEGEGEGEASRLPVVEPPPINVAANSPTSSGPMDATPSPDGTQVYYTALLYFEGAPVPAIFHVPADGGEPEVLHAGAPLVAPVGIATSLDGERLFVADSASGADGHGGAIVTLASTGGGARVLSGTQGYAPAGLVVAETRGEQRIYFTGRDPESTEAGVFAVGSEGGRPQRHGADASLVDPGGIAVARDGTIYVADALGSGDLASVVRIDGRRAEAFVERIGVGFPAGLTLTLDDSTLIVSGIDPATRRDVVYFVDAESAELSVMTEPVGAFSESAGLHRAHDENVFAWADSEANGSGTVYVLRP